MEDASRHARRLANNFLEDLDTMQRASRARDRRAMSHLETGVRSSSVIGTPVTDALERRRSFSYNSTRSYISSPPVSSSVHYYYPRRHSMYYPRTRLVTQYGPQVMMVGKSSYPTSSIYQPPHYEFPRTISNTVYVPPSNVPHTSSYWRELDRQIQLHGDLPTSNLRAHPPPRKHILTPRALVYLSDGLYPWRRSYSMGNFYSELLDEPVPRVIHSTLGRRTPMRSSRLGSVPPTTMSTTYRPTYYASEVGLPPAVPGRTYYRTNRYITETPYYLSSYSTRTAEPSRPILTTHYSSSPAPITQRYTYYYPSIVTGKLHTPYRVGSYTSLSPEVEYERRRIGRRMDDDLLEYKLPPPEYYRDMRGSLRSIHDKLDAHRRLLDRYSGIDMQAAPSSVEDRIESKYQQLANRMGRSFTGTAKA